MITLLKSGKVYDPQNKIFNVKKDIYIKDGQIINKKNITSKIDKVIDCSNKIVMPGAIDMHTHIGGGKVNIARLMLEEFHTEQNPNFDSTSVSYTHLTLPTKRIV